MMPTFRDDPHMDGCAISLFLRHSFNVDDAALPVSRDCFASLLTFAVSSRHLNCIIPLDGHESSLVLLLFGKRGRHILPVNEGRCVEMPFMVPSEVTKGLNFILATASSVMSAKGKSCIFFFKLEEL